MPLKSLKEKLANVAGGEILGDASAGERESKPSKPRKPKKTKIPSEPKVKKIKKPKEEKVEVGEISTKRKHSIFSSKVEDQMEIIEEPESNEEDEDKSQEIDKIRDSVEGYEDVLSILGIKESIDIDSDFTSDELDYIEFTQTQPIGFDFEEVTDFISRTKYAMHKLESALKQRDRDVVRVASQVKLVEQKMVEANQAKELERMMGGMTAEERLIEENMELKVVINDLNRDIKTGTGNKIRIKAMENELEVLRTENEMLRLNEPHLAKTLPTSLPKGLPKGLPTGYPEDNHSKLPAFKDSNENDMLEGMLKDIGGLYDDE